MAKGRAGLIIALVTGALMTTIPLFVFEEGTANSQSYLVLALALLGMLVLSVCMVEMTRWAWEIGGRAIFALVASVVVISLLVPLQNISLVSVNSDFTPWSFLSGVSVSCVAVVAGTLLVLAISHGTIDVKTMLYSAAAVALIGLIAIALLDGVGKSNSYLLLAAVCFGMVSTSFFWASLINRTELANHRSLWIMSRALWAIIYSVFITSIIYVPAVLTMGFS